MNKRIVSIMLTISIISTLGLSLPNSAEAGLRSITKNGDRHLFHGSKTARKKEPVPIFLKGVELKGTAVSGILTSVAIIEDTVTNKNYWYKRGDQLRGGTIVKINRGSIVLDMNGKLYLFGLPEGSIIDRKNISLAGNNKEDGVEDIILGKKIGENIWQVTQNAAIEIITKANKIIREARMRPYFAVGKAAGIRIDRIKDASVIKKMGIEDGDVIKGINGFGIMSPTKLFGAYRKYKDNKLIELNVLRNNEPTTLTYSIVR